jgi:polyphosphate kinase 2 (PPK2 family)
MSRKSHGDDGKSKGTKRKAEVAAEVPAASTELSGKDHAREMEKLHLELVKLQERVVATALKVCIVLEGRDGAGKGGASKAPAERVRPARVPRDRAASADRAREIADADAALPAALPRGRRNRDRRPTLLQPRWRRAGDGLLSG